MKNTIIGILATIVLGLSAWIGIHHFAQAPQNAAVASEQGIGACGQGMGMEPCGQARGMGQGRKMDFGQNPSNNQIPIADDTREFVKLPEMAKKIMRKRMLNNLMALNQILGLLADGKLKDASDIAETQIGNRRIGGGTGKGPSQFMPIGMRQMAMSMHKSVNEFARIARTGETTKAYTALQTITSVCAACHLSYRTQ